MKKIIAVIAILTLSIGVFYSCGKKEDNVVTIGAVLSLTGSGAEFGKDEQRSIDLFLEEISKKTMKYKYVVKYQDSKSEPKEGVNAMNKILLDGKPAAILSVLSSVCLAIKPITEKEKIPLFCVGANSQITDSQKYVFRSLPTSDYQAGTLAKKFIDKGDIDSFAVLYLNDDFGNGSFNSFKKIIEENGKKIISSGALDPKKADYRTEISSVLKSAPQAVYIACYGNSIAYVLQNLRELNFKGVILSTLEIGYPEVISLAKNTADGVYFVDTDFKDPQNSKRSEFIDKYKEKYKLEPSLDAVLAFDEINLIVETIEKNGTDAENFVKLKGLPVTYESANGDFKIDQKGNFLYSLVLKKIIGGNAVIVN